MNNIVERLKKIDNFFENLSIEEFEQKLEAAGINEIKSSSSVDMELSLSLGYIIDQNRNFLYIKKKEESNLKEIEYNFLSDYAKAV